MTTPTFETRYRDCCAEYRRKRYMEHASHGDLTQRFDDINANFIRFTDDGLAVVPAIESNPNAILIFHILEEMKLRGLSSFSFALKNFHLDDSKYPNVRSAGNMWRQKRINPPYLLRFSRLAYLKETLNRGSIRISPASFYRDSSLPAAIQDDELQFDSMLCGSDVRIQNDDGGWRSVRPVGPIRLSERADSDYYVYCFSLLFENRLFDDFKADACLIIKDPNTFCARMNERFNAVLPGWHSEFGGVQYLDPLQTTSTNICFTKHFRYAYQRELRCVWIPQQPQGHSITWIWNSAISLRFAS